jgi:hypothetical protein
LVFTQYLEIGWNFRFDHLLDPRIIPVKFLAQGVYDKDGESLKVHHDVHGCHDVMLAFAEICAE